MLNDGRKLFRRGEWSILREPSLFKNPQCLSSPPVRPHIIEKEVAVHTDIYPHGSSPTLRCTARGFPMPTQIEWQWMSKEDCPEAFL